MPATPPDNQLQPEPNLFEKAVQLAMKVPGVTVTRDQFLTATFKGSTDAATLERILAVGPVAAGVDPALLQRKSAAAIAYRQKLTAGTSFAAGLPGGVAMAATIPADAAQLVGHLLLTSQEQAYIYGWPAFTNPEGELDNEIKDLLLVMIGVMNGVAGATHALNRASMHMQQHVAKQLAQQALTKGAIYPIVKQVAKLVGVKMTKEVFAKSVAKAVPLLGGFASGALTYVTFGHMAYKLDKHLSENPFAPLDATFDAHPDVIDAEDVPEPEPMVARSAADAPASAPDTDAPALHARRLAARLTLFANLMKADGRIDPEEVAFIDAVMQGEGMSEADADAIRATYASPQMARVDVDCLRDDADDVLMELAALAWRDGTVHPAEKMYIRRVAKQLGVDTDEVERLLS